MLAGVAAWAAHLVLEEGIDDPLAAESVGSSATTLPDAEALAASMLNRHDIFGDLAAAEDFRAAVAADAATVL